MSILDNNVSWICQGCGKYNSDCIGDLEDCNTNCDICGLEHEVEVEVVRTITHARPLGRYIDLNE